MALLCGMLCKQQGILLLTSSNTYIFQIIPASLFPSPASGTHVAEVAEQD